MRFAQCAGLACAVAALLATGCQKETPPAETGGGKVVVVASVFPIADLVKQIGGKHVEVRCLLEPSRWPQGCPSSAVHADQFAGAKLIFVVGMGLDDWAVQAAKDAHSPARLVELASDPDFQHTYSTYVGSPSPATTALASRAAASQSGPASREAAPAGSDPFVWMDPIFMQNLAAIVLGELVRVDPENTRAFRGDANACLQELRKLDQDYERELASVRDDSNSFLTYTPAFGYVALRYKLKAIALDGSEASPVSEARMDDLRKVLKDRKVRAVFMQPQFPAGQLEALARGQGVGVGRLDALGNPFEPGYDSYAAMMRSNLRALVKGLSQIPVGKAP